jgi:hypothetical protein
VLRASPFLQWFRRGSNADHHYVGICGCLTDGVARNASEIGLRAVSRENDDVVCLVADNDLKSCGKGRVIPDPYAKLSVGGYHNLGGRQFAPG